MGRVNQSGSEGDIKMDTFKGIPFMGSSKTGTYATRNDKHVDVSFEALMKIMADLPDPPTMLRYKIEVNDMLPKNTIFVSSDIADVIEKEI